MKNLSNIAKNVTFQMVLVKNESGRIRVHPQPLSMLCIIIKYNLHFNIMNEHECGHFRFTRTLLNTEVSISIDLISLCKRF